MKPRDSDSGWAAKPERPSRFSLAPAERQRRRREWRIAAVVAIGLVLLALFEQRVVAVSRSLPIGSDWLFLAVVHLEVILMGGLVFLCARNLVKLVVDRRRGVLGARINTRFVLAFVIGAGFSTGLLFVGSSWIVTHSVGTWFQSDLSVGLDESLELGEAYYDEAERAALNATRDVVSEIEAGDLARPERAEALAELLNRKQVEHELGSIEVFNASLERLASVTHPEVPVLALETGDSEPLRSGLLEGRESSRVDAAGASELLRSVVPVRAAAPRTEVIAVVVANRHLPRLVGERAQRVRDAVAAYRRLEPTEGTFQQSMQVILALLGLVSLLVASWMGFHLAKQITDPIQRLAAGADQVAAGNLDVEIEQRGDDEIGFLVASFNRMATDLKANRADLARRRHQMEVVLRSVTAGVISLDGDAVITTINPSAMRLLGLGPGLWVGQKIASVLSGHALETVEDLLRKLAAGKQPSARLQVVIPVGDEHSTLNWTVSRLRGGEGDEGVAGFVVVLDDVTQILSAQRLAAWRDVARRIAHEIKNPLTPIQLSAQRMRRKLGPRVDEESRKLLEQSTEAITSQVTAMKLLLSEFSSFARLPATEPVPTQLNELAEELVAMYRGRASIRFSTALDPELPRLDLDREQIKRVILNLIDNGIHAIDTAGPGPREIHLQTSFDQEFGVVRLEIQDTGVGIAGEERLRIFQPDYSTREGGTGIGLAIVARIISDHSGTIRVQPNKPRGSRFVVEIPVRA